MFRLDSVGIRLVLNFGRRFFMSMGLIFMENMKGIMIFNWSGLMFFLWRVRVGCMCFVCVWWILNLGLWMLLKGDCMV